MTETLSFEAMPQAIQTLLDKVVHMQNDIDELKRQRPEPVEELIGIDEACKILHRAKSTVYALTQAHKIPFYQPGKLLQFKRSELMAWLESGKQESAAQTCDRIAREMQAGVKHKPNKSWGTL